MTRWGHGHTLAGGGLLTLLLVRQNLAWLLLSVFVAGMVAGRLWWWESRLAQRVMARVRVLR